jgi:hypothetical protein
MSKLLAIVSGSLLAGLPVFIWVASTAVAAAYDFTAMVATTLLPGVSQAYWIASIWSATGKVPQPLTGLCTLWLVLFAALIYARHFALARMAQKVEARA